MFNQKAEELQLKAVEMSLQIGQFKNLSPFNSLNLRPAHFTEWDTYYLDVMKCDFIARRS